MNPEHCSRIYTYDLIYFWTGAEDPGGGGGGGGGGVLGRAIQPGGPQSLQQPGAFIFILIVEKCDGWIPVCTVSGGICILLQDLEPT